jgi:2-polyprenyl-3-methyl-5-hydroxy-6-metoxy-1,4-benzoquinol methylase
MENDIFRGNNELNHWNEKHTTMYGHFNEKYEDFVPKDWDITDPGSDSGCIVAIMKQNKDNFQTKSVIDIGCAHGALAWYLKKYILTDWDVTGSDFSPIMIEENKRRSDIVNWEQRDVLLNPITENYGLIICNQTIEHFAPGDNYKFLDNILDHCEYAIVATVDTEDDCFGEHISFYKLETMEEKGYDVIWKNKLNKVNSPIPGDFYTIIWLIKGKL